VAIFDGLRPLLVTSHCSLRSLTNKLRSFVRSFVRFQNSTPYLKMKLRLCGGIRLCWTTLGIIGSCVHCSGTA